mmetsp:Transcript_7711/g.15990  ORF Transcript_7711/g.15990 Transcript_7711/m.15990 type:complete len:526 (-) Transcript_7711:674-2251(-)
MQDGRSESRVLCAGAAGRHGAATASLERSNVPDATLDGAWHSIQRASALQVPVDIGSRVAALADCPHDERLPTPAIASSEHARHRRRKLAKRSLVVGALILRHAQRLGNLGFGAQEAHRQQHHVGRQHALGASDLRRPSALHLDVHNLHAGELAPFADEALGHDAVLAWVLAVLVDRLRVAIVHPEDARPLRPRVAWRARVWRLREQLQVGDAGGAVAGAGADAVGAGVTTTNHNDVLAGRVNVVAVGELRVQQALGVGMEEVHRKVDALQVASLNWQVTRARRAHGQHHRVVLLDELLGRDVVTDVGVDHKAHALGGHQVDAALYDVRLVGLHVGHAVHHQAANAVRALVHRYSVAHLVELVSSGHAGRAAAHDRHLLARAQHRRLGHHPALLKRLVDDARLNRLDRHRVLNDAQHTRALARCGAHAAGELGEVVGLQQAVQCIAPLALVHKLVELRDLVAEWAATAALMAERGAAVHAARRLCVELVVVLNRGGLGHHLLVVLEALLLRAVANGLALIRQEAT